MSIDRGINKMCYIYTIAYISNRVYISHQKSEITPLAATWRDLDIVVLSEISQTEGEIAYDIPYIWSLKINNANELIYEKEKDSQTREQTYGRQCGKNGGKR